MRRHVDPTSFIEAAVVWAGINAASLLLSSPELFARPGFFVVRTHGLTQTGLGCTFLADMALLAFSLWGSVPRRSAIAVTSGIMWALYGSSTIISFRKMDFLSVSGLASVAVGIFCFRSALQWIYLERANAG